MIMTEQPISQNNTVFFPAESEVDFEIIIEECYSSSGENFSLVFLLHIVVLFRMQKDRNL